jgi:hypothetical protein
MTHAGRKPLGPALVEHLEGSQRAKERLEVVLETIAGHMTIDQACQRLEIGQAMFHRLRTEVLEAALARLEPRPIGRPPRQTTPESLRRAELERQIEELRSEVKIAAVREEIARVMPHLVEEEPPLKKTTPPPQQASHRRPAKRRRKHRPRD